MEGWQLYTFLAWEEQGGKCPICGQGINLKATEGQRLIGHHVKNRSKGGRDVQENCQARHAECECWAHKVAKDGNPGRSQIQRFRLYGFDCEKRQNNDERRGRFQVHRAR